MNDMFKSILAVVGISGALLLGNSTELSAKEWSPEVCTTDLVSGIYGFNARGFVVADEVIDMAERQAGTGIVKLRSNGTATFTVTRFFSGVPDFPAEDQPLIDTFEATWIVNPVCTGSVILSEDGQGVDWVFVVVDDANEVHFVSGATLSAVDAKRITKRERTSSQGLEFDNYDGEAYKHMQSHFKCDMKSVAGMYGGNVDNLSEQVEAQQRAVLFVIDLREDGTVDAKIIGYRADQVGMIMPINRIGEGNWKVAQDCTGILSVEFQGSSPLSLDLSLVAVENASEIFATGGTFLEEVDFMRIFSVSHIHNDAIHNY